MGKPNLIYVKNFLTEVAEMNLKKSINCTSGSSETGIHEVLNPDANNTYKNNTDISNTDNNPIRLDMQDPEMEERELYKEIVKENIHYEDLIRGHPLQRDITQQMIDLIRCIEQEGKSRIITPFVGAQIDICKAFGFDIPEGCSPEYVSRKNGEKRRGRPLKRAVEIDS